MRKELKRSWPGFLASIILAITLWVLFCVLAGAARADFPNYCGHGYITNGKIKDVFDYEYQDAFNRHRHVYRSYIKVSTIWIYEHSHNRICG